MSAFWFIIFTLAVNSSVISCFRLNITSDIGVNSTNKTLPKRVCIIGAGMSGLSAARYLKEEGINFTVFEATRYVGGTWRYDPRVGTDENGLPLHTSMYKNLRTNSPKPEMQLGGFPFPDNVPSFPGWEDYYEYIQSYAKHFDIEKYIQFLHKVVSVRREDDVWKVKHQHVQTKEMFEEEYDYVIVGNGRFSTPKMPNLTGENLFKGSIIHSHDYKTPDPYEGRRVLVIGAGPSGLDISIDVSKVSKKVLHSHHSRIIFKTPFVAHHIMKPDVKEFNETGAIFTDGTYEELDDVIYCTGYKLSYDFLDETSNLTISSHWVGPLHNAVVNMNQPSMFIMGFAASRAIAIDAQARYVTAVIKGNFTLPTREELIRRGPPPATYYDRLSIESGIARVPPVLDKIAIANIEAFLENLYTFRDYVYTVIDDEHYTRTLETKVTRQDRTANETTSFITKVETVLASVNQTSSFITKIETVQPSANETSSFITKVETVQPSVNETSSFITKVKTVQPSANETSYITSPSALTEKYKKLLTNLRLRRIQTKLRIF